MEPDYMIPIGLFELPLWGYAVAMLALTHVSIAAVTIFLHRHQAHRALDLHPLISHFFRFWLWLTTGMKTKEWVAVHRKHHAKCESVDDPHSPQVVGINQVLWLGVMHYRREAGKAETLAKYGHGTPDDWLERNVYDRFCFAGVLSMLLIDLLLFGLAGMAVWGLQMLWIPFWAAGVINGIGHYWGYRNYECTDASTNIVPWGIIIGGEELHNNHHTWPSSAKLSSKRWELDIGWLYIRLLSAFGLARVKKVAPMPQVAAIKPIVDMDTLRAVLTNRFRVMAYYCKHVLLPVLREERRHLSTSAQGLFKHARRLLVRDETLLDHQAREKLDELLSVSKRLKIAYVYKQRLQQIWKRSTVDHDALLFALREWCRQAEAAGISALQDFARGLRGYTLATA
jgi:stearoyl-CoA desaturase (delta-9 desaturase)